MLSFQYIDEQCPRGLVFTNESMSKNSTWITTPFNESCIHELFLNITGQLVGYTLEQKIVYTVIYVVMSLMALIGNGVVILAVIRKREMRTNRNVLIVNLALSNLMLALTTVPFLWVPSMHYEFPYSTFFCKFANALPGSNIYCSTLTISVMAIDRYYSIKNINISTSNHSCIRAIIISVAIWILSFLLSFPLLVYYNTNDITVFSVYLFSEKNNTTEKKDFGLRQCQLESTDDDASHARQIQLAMSALQVIFLYVVPLVMLAIFNARLTRFLKNNERHIIQMKIQNPGTVSARSRTTTNGQSSGLSEFRDSIHNVLLVHTAAPSDIVLASKRRRSRTTALLIAMAMSYAVLWLPFTLVTFIIDIKIINRENLTKIDDICKLISIFSICVNPFLYGYLNTNFRHEFTEIFNVVFSCLSKLEDGKQILTSIRDSFLSILCIGRLFVKAANDPADDTGEEDVS